MIVSEARPTPLGSCKGECSPAAVSVPPKSSPTVPHAAPARRAASRPGRAAARRQLGLAASIH
eukprot:6852187-Prymnesium_polylepis.1